MASESGQTGASEEATTAASPTPKHLWVVGVLGLLWDSVGAFDYAVLQSETVDDLVMWLQGNDYYQDPAAAPILDRLRMFRL